MQIRLDRIAIAFDPAQLSAWLLDTAPPRGHEMRLVIDSPDPQPEAKPEVARFIARAHRIARRALNEHASLDDIAREEGIGTSYATRMIRLTFLAPDLIARLIGGQHRPDLSPRQLMTDTRIPLAWAEQRTVFHLS